ncbi:hypothetical protein DSD97_23325, partial [Salmonella enterica]|nr:hypothetical protein [Salmonella enterica]
SAPQFLLQVKTLFQMILFRLNHTSRHRPKQTKKPSKNNKLAIRTNMINIRKEAIDNENNNPNNTTINFCFFRSSMVPLFEYTRSVH